MNLTIASLGSQPVEGSAAGLLVSSATPVVLSVELDADEILVGASLTVSRSAASAPLPTVVVDTDVGGATSGVQWISASWAEARSLAGFTLSFTNAPANLVVRSSIARGGSSWFQPPGPHTFNPTATPLAVTFPEAIAERLLIELLDSNGAPTTDDFAAVPVVVSFDDEPQDVSIAVEGRRPLLRFGGAIPVTEGIVVDDLLSRLEAELGGPIRGGAQSIELRAEVAGTLDIEWAFSSVRVEDRFADQTAARTVTIPWGGTVQQALLGPEAGPVELDSLRVSVVASPVFEQQVLGPPPGLTAGRRQLVAPLYDVAQSFVLDTAWELTGVDLLARALSDGTTVRLGLHADVDGRPTAGATVEAQQEVDATTQSRWLTFTFDEAIAADAGIWWLVVSVDEGELLWRVGTEVDGSPSSLLARREEALWLPLTSHEPMLPSGTMRVRAKGVPPSMPVSVALRGTNDTGTGPTIWSTPLTIDDEGVVAWAPNADDPPLVLSDLSLEISAEVEATVLLSTLELRYRDQ